MNIHCGVLAAGSDSLQYTPLSEMMIIAHVEPVSLQVGFNGLSKRYIYPSHGCQFLQRGLLNVVYRSKMVEKQPAAPRPDAGYRIQARSEALLGTQLAMGSDGEAMGFVSHPLYQIKTLRLAW